MNSLDFFRIAGYIIIFGATWNFVRGQLPDGPARRAMSFIFN